jgi:hypothetical protein
VVRVFEVLLYAVVAYVVLDGAEETLTTILFRSSELMAVET